MRYFKLTIAYDGTDFHGWQMQAGKPTIQGEIVGVLRGSRRRTSFYMAPAAPTRSSRAWPKSGAFEHNRVCPHRIFSAR